MATRFDNDEFPGDSVALAGLAEGWRNFSATFVLSSQQRNRADWQLLEKPFGVMPARLFLLTLGG
jgi:hypothetical protein